MPPCLKINRRQRPGSPPELLRDERDEPISDVDHWRQRRAALLKHSIGLARTLVLLRRDA